MTHTSDARFFVLMPSSEARSSFSAAPRTAMPMLVKRKNSTKATSRATVTAARTA